MLASCERENVALAAAPAADGMVRLQGGEFRMGCDSQVAQPNEKPVHTVRVRPFCIDVHDVTNEEFARFVDATRYVTLAERKPEWEEIKKQVPPGTPRPPEDVMVPGSLVFHPTQGPVELRDLSQWWTWTPGASWRHPEGPGSTIEGREKHPVVQIAYEDAEAYARWVSKRLPTEAEWEFAARAGLDQARYAWGDESSSSGKAMANTWTGEFPWRNTAADGFTGTAPVGSFPPNAFGLYDMGGNVWNWCSDVYAPDTFAKRAEKPSMCCDPTGPANGAGIEPMPGDPSPADVPGIERRVIKGGSFLCNPSYCESYRPAARRGVPPDTSTAHTGFRCARDVAGAK
jgi:formylglycine-generating enzyme required for sulfatase activity